MATQSGGKPGATPDKDAMQSASKRRATSKPVIIDLDADAVSSPAASSAAGATPKKESSASKSPADKKPEPTAAPTIEAQVEKGSKSGSEPGSKVDPKAGSKAAPEPKTPPQDPVGTVVPPAAVTTSAATSAASGAASKPSGPSAFYLFAAGFIGALLALIMMFVAAFTGLLSLPDGRLDDQASALGALQARVSTVESAMPSSQETAFDPAVLTPLQDALANLRTDLDNLSLSTGDAAPVDLSAMLGDELAPLEARIGAVEASLQAALDALESAQPGTVVAPDPALAGRVDELAANLALLEAAASTTVFGTGSGSDAGARLDALDGQLAATGEQVTALSSNLSGLQGTFETLARDVALRLDGVDSAMETLANAPVAQVPDQLARLGVALDALVRARDGGDDVQPPLQAAIAAASFDGALSGAFSPVAQLSIAGDVSNAALRGTYDAAYSAMRAVVPTDEDAGILGALEQRARQLVTIRAPEDVALGDDASALDQLDQLGRLISAGRHDEALSLANGLPASMQEADGGLLGMLTARVALDRAVSEARAGLLAELTRTQAAQAEADSGAAEPISQ